MSYILPTKQRKQRKQKQNGNTTFGSMLSGGSGIIQRVHNTRRIIAPPSFVAPRWKGVLTYAEVVGTAADGSVATTTGSAVTYQLNSLFQPRGSGHQPYGFDTLSTMYAKYRVTRVKIDGSCVIRDTSKNAFAFVGIFPSANTFSFGSVAAAYNLIPEKPNCGMFHLQGSGNRSIVDWAMDVDMATIEGVTKNEYTGSSLYTALVGANPTNMITMQVASSSDSVGTAIDWRVTISFECEFYERSALSQS